MANIIGIWIVGAIAGGKTLSPPNVVSANANVIE